MGAHLHIHRTVLFVYFVYIDVHICRKRFSHDIDVSNDIIYHIMLALALKHPQFIALLSQTTSKRNERQR